MYNIFCAVQNIRRAICKAAPFLLAVSCINPAAAETLQTATVAWTNCAQENGVCSFDGSRQIRYGGNGSYVYRSATNSVACSNGVFGDPAYGTVKSCAYASTSSSIAAPSAKMTTDSDTGWVSCAHESGVCSFSGSTQIRYGANNVFAYKTAIGSITCNNDTFGDPLPGIVKSCAYPSTTSAVLTLAPIQTPTENPTENLRALKGVNISGGEFNNNNVTARLHFDYEYPSNVEIDYYASKGMTVIRLPFSGARMQPINNRELNINEVTNIQKIVSYCAAKGIKVILDPHDYGKKYDSVSKTMKVLGVAGGLPSSDFADFWRRMAIAFKSQPNVIFGLMNEPNVQTPTEWKTVAVAAVDAIRKTGATQKILIPGSRWTSAEGWVSSGNAAVWIGFRDPGNNFAFEVHQYLDKYSSGTTDVCVMGKGKDVLNQATLWARTNGYRLFLGETGWARNATCLSEGAALMNYASANPDVWSGWTYWAGGSWWRKDYMFLIRPDNLAAPLDRPQMTTLLNNL